MMFLEAVPPAGNFTLEIWLGIVSFLGAVITIAAGVILTRTQTQLDRSTPVEVANRMQIEIDQSMSHAESAHRRISEMQVAVEREHPRHDVVTSMENRMVERFNKIDAKLEMIFEKLDNKQDK